MLTPRDGVERTRTSRPRLPIGRRIVEKHQKVHGARGRQVRVLLVEGDEPVPESTRRLLELEGLVVSCAFDGQAGLAKALSGSDDVILLDRMLPGLSGDDLLERLRANGSSTSLVNRAVKCTTSPKPERSARSLCPKTTRIFVLR